MSNSENKSCEGRTQKVQTVIVREQRYKLNILGRTTAILAIVALFAGCGNRTNVDVYDVENYPVAEISEGLTQAAQTFSEVYEFHDSLAIVKGGLSCYGVIDREGNLVIPCEYTELERCGKVFYACQLKNCWGIIDRNGKELVPCRYEKDDVTVYPNEEIIRYIEKDKYGMTGNYINYFKDFTGKKLFDKGLNSIKTGFVAFNEGLASTGISSKSYRWYGYVDKTGKTVISPRYEDPATFFNGVAMVSEYKDCHDNYVSFIDKQGNVVMKVVKDGNMYGIVDTSGKEVVPCKFKSIDCYDSGCLLTTGMNNLQGIWSIKDRKEIAAPMYEILPDDNNVLGCKTFVKDNSVIIVKKDGKYGAINIDGKEIVSCVYEYAQVEKGVIEVTQGMGLFNSKKGVYDFDGNELLKCEYYLVNIDENSIISDKIKDDISSKQTFLYDHKGNLIIKVGALGEIRHFSEGMAAVKKEKNKGFGFYDYDGDEVIEPRYEDAKTFSEGLAPVKLNGKCGYVNRKGVDTFGNK